MFENYVSDVRVDGIPVQLALWDTAGQEDYERLRPLSYAKSHVVLIGFSIDSPDSLENVSSKWIHEINEYVPNVPVLLVGMKKDLRTNELAIQEMRTKSLDFVNPQDAQNVANRIGAKKYLECSALSGEGVDDVFEAATRFSLPVTKLGGNKASCCIIL